MDAYLNNIRDQPTGNFDEERIKIQAAGRFHAAVDLDSR
jgi:hypothetical protein